MFSENVDKLTDLLPPTYEYSSSPSHIILTYVYLHPPDQTKRGNVLMPFATEYEYLGGKNSKDGIASTAPDLSYFCQSTASLQPSWSPPCGPPPSPSQHGTTTTNKKPNTRLACASPSRRDAQDKPTNGPPWPSASTYSAYEVPCAPNCACLKKVHQVAAMQADCLTRASVYPYLYEVHPPATISSPPVAALRARGNASASPICTPPCPTPTTCRPSAVPSPLQPQCRQTAGGSISKPSSTRDRLPTFLFSPWYRGKRLREM